MTVYLVGVGRMGKLVARYLAPKLDLVLVGRDRERLEAAAREVGARTAPIDTDFAGATAVIFALPTEATAPVMASLAPRIPAEAVVINIATAVLRKDLAGAVAPERLAAAKFVGHYYDMQAGGSAVLVVEAGSDRAEQVAAEIMGHCGPVVPGKEEWVLTTNRTATEEAVRLAVRMQRRLEAAGIPAPLIKQATTGVAVGSLRAFMDGRLGPFGQAIADKLKKDLDGEQ